MKITKRGSKWQYDFRYDGERFRGGGYSSKRDAQYAGNEKYNQLSSNIRLDRELTFADYFKKWIETNRYHTVTPKTYKSYKSALIHIEDHSIGSVRLKDTTRHKFQEFINEYAKSHAKETIKKFKGYCNACFESAVFEGTMIKNINHNITYTPGTASKHEDTKFIQMKDYERVKAQLKKSKSQSSLFLFVMLITGARFSCAAALKRDHIDELKSTIFIDEHKTELSPRTLSIPREDLRHVLEGIKNIPVQSDGKIFKLSYEAVNKQMKRVCTQLNIDEVTSHALRHTHCSYLFAKGLSIEYISRRLGHANVATTREIYQHMFKETYIDEDAKAMEILSSMESKAVNG